MCTYDKMEALFGKPEAFVRGGYAIVRDAKSGEGQKNTLYLDVGMLQTCEDQSELIIALKKRLEERSGIGRVPRLGSVALWVLCAPGYSLNTTVMPSIDHVDICTVWSTLETMKTSSGPRLSKWLTSAMSHRTMMGYSKSARAETNPVTTAPADPVLRLGTTIVRISNKDDAKFGGIGTYTDLMSIDYARVLALSMIHGDE